MNCGVPEIALYLRHHSTKSCNERGEDVLIPMSGVDWLTCICKNQEMLPYLIKLLEGLRDVDIPDAWVYIVTAHLELKLRLHSVSSRLFCDRDGSCTVLRFSYFAEQLCLLINMIVIWLFLQQWGCKRLVVLILLLVGCLGLHLITFDIVLG